MDMVLKAIHDANMKYPDLPKLQTSMEINRVQDVLSGKKRALNAVFPQLKYKPDIIGYSSYDTLYNVDDFTQALQLIKEKAPECRLMISEFGIPENKVKVTPAKLANVIDSRIRVAKEFGAEHFMYWQLLDNETKKTNPDSQECDGYWMVRPDGSFSDAYDSLRKHKA